MELSKHLIIIMTLLFLRSIQLLQAHPSPKRSNLFREYIGAEFAGVKFSDVPINPNVDFHFILSFALDYDATSSPTNGRFNVFWDSDNLGPSQVASLKRSHPNVRVAVSLGGDTVGDGRWAYFSPASVESWVSNAASSLTRLAGEYGLDGIDVDYEHFSADPRTFAECIGRLILNLKRNGVISFASIAPFDDGRVQAHYLALWERYGRWIDYVNFQFYAYDRSTTVSQFLEYFDEQSSKYRGGKLLVSLISDGSGGLSPEKGFFEACDRLKREKRLHGIFIWSADDSKKNGFRYETRSQALLA